MGDLMRRARWRRADFNAQAAHRLTRDYAIVTLERLNVRAMTACVAPRPDPGAPGAYLPNGRAAKAGLNRSILDKGWYGLEAALRSKARYTGTDIRVVDPAYTSQTWFQPGLRGGGREEPREPKRPSGAPPAGMSSTLM